MSAEERAIAEVAAELTAWRNGCTRIVEILHPYCAESGDNGFASAVTYAQRAAEKLALKEKHPMKVMTPREAVDTLAKMIDELGFERAVHHWVLHRYQDNLKQYT